MLNKLKSREKRILAMLLVTVVLVLGMRVVEPMLKEHQLARVDRLELQGTLDDFLGIQSTDAARHEAIARMVPVFELPVKAEQQSILFRDMLTKQLQKSGMKSKSVQVRQNKSKKADGYQVWTVECQGQCEYQSIPRFVEEVKKNPYYVAIEKLVLKADTKDRNKMAYYLTVSTYAK